MQKKVAKFNKIIVMKQNIQLIEFYRILSRQTYIFYGFHDLH